MKPPVHATCSIDEPSGAIAVHLAAVAAAPRGAVRVERDALGWLSRGSPVVPSKKIDASLEPDHFGSSTGRLASSPPSTRSSVPVTADASSLARYAIAAAISSGAATRPSGCMRPQ